MTWREYEREIAEFFEREGVAVLSPDGDKRIEVPPRHTWDDETCVSLTRLARRLADR